MPVPRRHTFDGRIVKAIYLNFLQHNELALFKRDELNDSE